MKKCVSLKFSFSAEVVLNDYEKYRLGTHTAEEDIINAHLARGHGELFCKFMLGHLPSSAEK